MQLELPGHLLATRDVLARSLPSHAGESAPVMPANLTADLAARFGAKAPTRNESTRISWMDKVRTFLATPAFGAVAAAVVVMGVAVPMMTGGEKADRESFRGGETMVASGDQVRIIFVGENAAVRSAVEASGDFEASALISAASADAARSEKGAKVIVDFTSKTVTSFDTSGSEVSRKELPADAKDVSGVISRAVSGL
jgi:hypothetical protein